MCSLGVTICCCVDKEDSWRSRNSQKSSQNMVQIMCRLCAVLNTLHADFESCKWAVDYLVCSSTEAVEVATE